MPTARDHLTSGVVDGKLYVIGGRQNPLTNLDVNEEYDPINDKWTTRAPMPSDRGAIDAASLSDSIYVFCGETPTITFANNEQYIPSLDIWIVREDMPTARTGCAVAEVGGSIYVIGGNTKPPYTIFSPTTKNEVFTPLSWKTQR
jgi:N-acetylneuraminic acid mutarotase